MMVLPPKLQPMILAELHRSELSAVTESSYLIQTMSTQTARLKIQLLTLSASTVSHTAVTAFYPTIILMTEQKICKINMNRFLILTTVIRQEHRTVIHTSIPIPAGRISWQRLTAVIFHTMQTAIRFHTVTEWALNGRTEESSRI